MAQLILLSGGHRGRALLLDRSGVLGRSPEADLVVADGSVSRRHASIARKGQDCWLADLGSVNGTFVNGHAISAPVQLKDGDRLRFGNVLAKFVFGSETGPASQLRVVDAPSGAHVLATIPARSATPEALRGIDAGALAQMLTRQLGFLEGLGRLSGEAFNEDRLLDFVVEQLLEVLPQADRAIVLVREPGQAEFSVRTLRTRHDRDTEQPPVSRTILRDVTERREGVLLADAGADQRYAGAYSVAALRLRTILCAPLIADGEVVGVIEVSGATVTPFTPGDLRIVLGIAAHAGLALGFARLHGRIREQELLERDMELARRVQQQLLPASPPRVEGFEFAVEYDPAWAVGGDFYDFLPVPGSGTVAALGDVCGKGVSAALFAARVASDLRYISAADRDPGSILDALNDRVAATSDSGMFLTLVLAAVDPATARVQIACAGHPLPILRSPGSPPRELGKASNPAVGIRPGWHFTHTEHHLQPGESVIFYSDGVSEALNAKGEVFGVKRLLKAIEQAGEGVQAIRASTVAAIQAFAGATEQSDDITLVCVSRLPRA